MVIFHKYFLFVKTFNQDFTKYLTCFSCIFISFKISNIILPLEDLLKIFLKIYYKENIRKININKELISAISKKVFQIESDIMSVIGFDINIDLPYDYISLMKDYFIWNFQPEILRQIKVIIISFINDSFKLPLCLYYHPLLIFLACLNLLSEYFNFELKEKDGVKWFNLIERDIAFEDLVEISSRIRVIYDYTNYKEKICNGKKNVEKVGENNENKFALDFHVVKSSNFNKINENKIFSVSEDDFNINKKNNSKEKDPPPSFCEKDNISENDLDDNINIVKRN